MPTLIVLRHAKAVAGLGIPDRERSLNDRGRRDSTATGQWLREHDLVPGHVLCSTSVRTRETLDRLALDAEVSYEPRIYDNDADELIDLLREIPDGTRRAMLVGHNPSVHQLVHDLCGEGPESFPTCALAVIDLPCDWPDVTPETGRLVTVRTPKG